MIRGRLRLFGLLAACVLALLAFLGPTASGERAVHQYLFVVDVTRSMTVTDYLVNGEPVSRLELTREALRQVLRALPCDSRVGIGLFSGWQTGILLEPVEVCAHRQELGQLVEDLDWRLGWVPQSNVQRALRHGMLQIGRMEQQPSLVFMTDGDEAPSPLRSGWSGSAPPELASEVILVGTGAEEPSNVPRLDQRDEVVGFLSLPSGAPAVSGLDQSHLQELAEPSGFRYHLLRDVEGLVRELTAPERAAMLPGRYSLSPWLASAALMLILVLHLPGLSRFSRSPSGK